MFAARCTARQPNYLLCRSFFPSSSPVKLLWSNNHVMGVRCASRRQWSERKRESMKEFYKSKKKFDVPEWKEFPPRFFLSRRAKLQLMRRKMKPAPIVIPKHVRVVDVSILMKLPAFSLLSCLYRLDIKVKDETDFVDADVVALIADEFGFTYKQAKSLEQEDFRPKKVGKTSPRPLIATVLGHVDHGKTTLLDTLRNANVAAGEDGGITQHVSSFLVKLKSGFSVTFVDTPGHAAFSEMRARARYMTDIVLLVVSADRGVEPQTEESIEIIKDNELPLLVVITKIDKKNANVEKTMRDLARNEIYVEQKGGMTPCVCVSSTRGTNIEDIEQALQLFESDIEPVAHSASLAEAIVLESKTTPTLGCQATVIVMDGTLKKGDVFVCEDNWGKVKVMTDDRGQSLMKAPPSTPVIVSGFQKVPPLGKSLYVVPKLAKAKNIIKKRDEYLLQMSNSEDLILEKTDKVEEDDFDEEEEEEVVIPQLNIIVKVDVSGSVEPVYEVLDELSQSSKVDLNIVRCEVGALTEKDIFTAQTTGSEIFVFGQKVSADVTKESVHARIRVQSFNIIYKLQDAVAESMLDKLPPATEYKVCGKAVVQQPFEITENKRKVPIAGCRVTEGSIIRNRVARVLRHVPGDRTQPPTQLYEGLVDSLRHFKEDSREVKSGNECGVRVGNFNDYRPEDIIQLYEIIESRHPIDYLFE